MCAMVTLIIKKQWGRGLVSKGGRPRGHMMDVHAYAQETCMPIVLVADAVRASQVGDEVRVHTDVEALISDMRAFAHMSGNAVDRVEPRARVTVDLFENGEHVFSPDARV